MQVNHITKQPYTNQNQSILQNSFEVNKYTSPEWLTFLQAKELGRKIKKGSKGIVISRVIQLDTEDGKDERKIRHFIVFNLDQTEIIT